jgi:hypothetical protein
MSPKARTVSTQPPSSELLPALLPKHELRPMINKARRYARSIKRNATLLAVELRRLQDAGAHQTYGRASFGGWAAIEFAEFELTPENAKKLSEAGRVILALERNGRVDLEDPTTFPGTGGVRLLSSVLSSHGEQAMLQVYEACPPERIVADTVRQAIDAVLPPPAITALPDIGQDRDWEEDVEEPEERSPEAQELHKRVERLRRYLDELALADDADPIAITREYEHFVTDAQELGPVLNAVLPGEERH